MEYQRIVPKWEHQGFRYDEDDQSCFYYDEECMREKRKNTREQAELKEWKKRRTKKH